MLLCLRLAGLLLTGAGGGAPAISWETPAGCPDEMEVRAQVDALLAGAPADAARDVQVHLRVDALPDGGWRLQVTMSEPGGAGRRSLDAASCGELAEAAALLTAIAMHPDLVPLATSGEATLVPPVRPEPAPAPAIVAPVTATTPAKPVAPAVVATPAPEVSPAPTRPRRSLRWPLGVRAGVGLGAVPGVAALLRLSTGVRGRRWGGELAQSFWLPRDFPAAGDARVGGELWLWAAGARGCGYAGPERVEVPLCAAYDVIVVGLEGREPDPHGQRAVLVFDHRGVPGETEFEARVAGR